MKDGSLFVRSGFKTSDRAQGQGESRSAVVSQTMARQARNGAYMGVCEYFEEVRSTVFGCYSVCHNDVLIDVKGGWSIFSKCHSDRDAAKFQECPILESTS